MVPAEEAPREDDIDGDAMAEDNKEGYPSDAGMSSTMVSPEPILIPAPMQATMCTQKAIKGRGTKDCPYDLDFTLTVRQAHGIPPESC